MPKFLKNYLTVTADLTPLGFNLCCWMSPQEFWRIEAASYPFIYTHVSNRCTWIIHANMDLSANAIAMVTEYADKICMEQSTRNERRKLANR